MIYFLEVHEEARIEQADLVENGPPDQVVAAGDPVALRHEAVIVGEIVPRVLERNVAVQAGPSNEGGERSRERPSRGLRTTVTAHQPHPQDSAPGMPLH